MMSAEREKQNDRDGNADQPQDNGPHYSYLRRVRPAQQGNARAPVPSSSGGGLLGGEYVGAPAEMGGTEHDGGGIDDDHDDEPAKKLERH